jgi:hypothetical protein
VRFQVLTAASMMFRAVVWVILPCKMIDGSLTQKTALNNPFIYLRDETDGPNSFYMTLVSILET